MKSLIIIRSFLRQNIVPILIIIIIMSASLFFLVSAYGSYRFVTAVRDIFTDAGLENTIYFMYSYDSSKEVLSNDLNCYRDEIEALSACEEIIEPYSAHGMLDGQRVNVKLYADTMIESFPIDVDKGRWLQPNADKLEAVVCNIDDVNVGDTLELSDGIKATIVGICNDKVYLPTCNHSSSVLSADKLFMVGDLCAVVNIEAISEKDLDTISPSRFINYYVRISADASEAEQEELIGKLSAYGTYKSYDDIIEYTNAEIDERLRELLPLPVFLLIVTSILLVAITALSIKKSINEHSCYYIIGCSKRRSFMLISAALSMVFSVPCIINLILVVYFPYFLRNDSGVYSGEYIDKNCIIPLIIYFSINVVITIIIPMIYYRSFSPLDLHRRNI